MGQYIDPSLTVDEDVVWSGQDRILDRPVIVMDGGRLLIEGCHIRVLQEDFLMWMRPPFSVEEGGSLEVIDSTIEVANQSYRESAIYFGAEHLRSWRREDLTPVVSRVMHLAGSESPTLTFDASWRDRSTDLVVFGQKGVGEDFFTVARIEAPPVEGGTWSSHEVPLWRLGDGVARVAITPANMSFGGLLLSNLSLADGDGSLPYDIPSTGDPEKDGWRLGPFTLLGYDLVLGVRWPGLIISNGSVEVHNSRITAPDGLPRWMDVEVEWEEALLPSTATEGSNQLITSKGGHIFVEAGCLTVSSSLIRNVPVLVSEGHLELAGTEVLGDADLVSLLRSRGSIEGVAFESTNASSEGPFSYGYAFDDKYLWAVSIEGRREGAPIRVANSTFNNHEVALDLDGARVELEGCEFHGIWNLCVWDHDSTGLGGWSGVNATNRFLDSTGFPYLKTLGCELSFSGPDLPTDGYFGFPGGVLLVPEESSLPAVEVLWVRGDGATLFTPQIVVNSTYHQMSFEDVTLHVHTSWGGARTVAVDCSSTRLEVVFPERDPDEDTDSYTDGMPNLDSWLSLDTMEADGELRIGVDLETRRMEWYGFIIEPFLEVLIDNESKGGFSLTKPIENEVWSVERHVNASIGPGRHVVRWTVCAVRYNESTATTLVDDNRTILRVTKTTPIEEVVGFLREGGYCLLLDRGVQLDLSSYDGENSEYPDYRWIDLHLVSFDECSITYRMEGDPMLDYFSIDQGGRCDVVLDGLRSYSIYLRFEGANATLKDVDCTLFDIYGCTESNVSISNLTVDECFSYFSAKNSSVMMTGSAIRTDDGMYGCYQSYSFTNTSLHLSDCAFARHGFSEMGWAFDEATAVVMENTSFDNMSLVLYLNYGLNGALGSFDITGCSFTGTDALLSLVAEDRLLFGWDPWTLRGSMANNTFSGEGAGIVLNWDLFRALLGGNRMVGGARIFAYYPMKVELDADEGDAHGQYRAYPMWPVPDIALMRQTILDRIVNDCTSLLDVTDDPNEALHPGGIPIVVRAYQYGLEPQEIVWFEFVDPLSDGGPVKVPWWEPLEIVETELVESMPDPFWS